MSCLQVAVLAVLVIYINEVDSRNTGRDTVPNPDMPICSGPRPCDMTIGHGTGQSMTVVTTEEAICACRNAQCPVGWQQDNSRSITIEITPGESPTLVQFHYCENVPAVRDCQGSEVAMTTQGNGIFPRRIEHFNCKCPHNDPMVVKKMRYRFGQFRQDYACSLPVCEINSTAPQVCTKSKTTRFGGETSYICKCPEGFRCTQRIGHRNGHCTAP